MADRSGLYLLEAYGLKNPLVQWRIRRGDLGDLCRGCAGGGIIVTSPCENRGSSFASSAEAAKQEPTCTRDAGCNDCRRSCPTCGGSGMPTAPVHAEDFGDEASRAVAQQAFPNLDVNPYRRSESKPPALGERPEGGR